MKEKDFIKVLEFAKSIFKCGEESIHGIDHWERVRTWATKIANKEDADKEVIVLFAYLHDSCRYSDGIDINHGPRAADLLHKIPELLKISKKQLYILEYAIREHTNGKLSDNITIGACWDADRLDLGRAGIIPNESMMSTKTGKEFVKIANNI